MPELLEKHRILPGLSGLGSGPQRRQLPLREALKNSFYLLTPFLLITRHSSFAAVSLSWRSSSRSSRFDFRLRPGFEGLWLDVIGEVFDATARQFAGWVRGWGIGDSNREPGEPWWNCPPRSEGLQHDGRFQRR